MDTPGKLVVGVFALAMACLITFLVIRECYAHYRGKSLVPPKQFRFRMVGAAILFGLIIMMCAGVYVVDFTSLAFFIAYWITFALISIVPVAMSLIDLRRLAKVRQEEQRALRKEMAQFIHEHAERVREAGSPATKGNEAPGRG